MSVRNGFEKFDQEDIARADAAITHYLLGLPSTGENMRRFLLKLAERKAQRLYGQKEQKAAARLLMTTTRVEASAEESIADRAQALVGDKSEPESNLGKLETLLRKRGEQFVPGEHEIFFTVEPMCYGQSTRENPKKLPAVDRRVNMKVNRRLLNAIYERFQVDFSRQKIEFSAPGREWIETRTTNFSPLGIGFIEFASYLAHENQHRPIIIEDMTVSHDYPFFLMPDFVIPGDNLSASEEENQTYVPERFWAGTVLLVDGDVPNGY